MASRDEAALAAAPRGKDFYEALGRAIKVTRAEQGLERKELARLSGLSYPYLSEIERPESRASSFRSSPCSARRSEEHTSELQSPDHLVCRLLLEKKKKNTGGSGEGSPKTAGHPPSSCGKVPLLKLKRGIPYMERCRSRTPPCGAVH